MSSQSTRQQDYQRVSAEEFRTLLRLSCRWGRWGWDDERGALHLLTPGRLVQAANLVQEGVSVSLGLRVDTVTAPYNPKPADHHMTALGDGAESQGVHFLRDYIGVDYHCDGHTHIDALCHVGFDGLLYGGRGVDSVTSEGASACSIEVLRDGLVGRGVLLDIPRLRGTHWLEPGESVSSEELEQAEREQGVTVEPGDILLVRTGIVRRIAELGPWNTAEAKAGLDPRAMRLVGERGVSALGSDGNSDTAPSNTEGVAFPVHVLAINALGIHLLDYLQLEDLRSRCEQAGRWEFLFVGAPLRIVGGTGSPLNPLAIF